MVTAISRFRVRNGLEQEVRLAFLNRPRLVETAPGFCGLEVLTDSADPSLFLLLTRWTDEESFRAWHRSDAHRHSHELIPHGLKLDPSFTSLTIGIRIEESGGVQNLSDALEGQTVSLTHWLMESDAVFALLLAPDGTIRTRNRAANRMFPDQANIWDCLMCSDSEALRRRLSDASAGQGSLLLNLTDGRQNPITLEAGFVPCRGATLLLGIPEHRLDASFRTEVLQQAGDLSVMMREAAQKNRELKDANETIERLARTDALTGLANRRTLYEALEREIARAARLEEGVSVIIADLDHFKSINDQYGHMAGDRVLAAAASVFASQSRPYDLAARYGGEEFVLLLPSTPAVGACAVAERMRNAIAEMTIAESPRQLTISLGVAAWVAGESPEHLMARADAALYKAKKSGRNRVVADAGPQ